MVCVSMGRKQGLRISVRSMPWRVMRSGEGFLTTLKIVVIKPKSVCRNNNKFNGNDELMLVILNYLAA
jgi:hypothetical protein